MIKYAQTSDGGFVVGDTETGRTAYAYPTSPNADEAHHMPEQVAIEMIANAIACCAVYGRQSDFDARNWETLNDIEFWAKRS